ncbi:hypothetical protein C1H46_000152 [Malus baccata]|uniref:Uncharacterized protein n=1 Tax=Malus baccata TaxID=106549 RepID=A0A540NUH0_MALBA|nr:hypothetical protein C1H46_000152 [Malus baccata]
MTEEGLRFGLANRMANVSCEVVADGKDVNGEGDEVVEKIDENNDGELGKMTVDVS